MQALLCPRSARLAGRGICSTTAAAAGAHAVVVCAALAGACSLPRLQCSCAAERLVCTWQAVLPSGRQMVTGDPQGHLDLWELPEAVLARNEAPSSEVCCMVFVGMHRSQLAWGSAVVAANTHSTGINVSLCAALQPLHGVTRQSTASLWMKSSPSWRAEAGVAALAPQVRAGQPAHHPPGGAPGPGDQVRGRLAGHLGPGPGRDPAALAGKPTWPGSTPRSAPWR